MSDARSGRDAAESRVGEQGNMLSEIEMLERRRDLVNLLHARAHWPAAYQHQNVARFHLPRLDGCDGGGLSDENARLAHFAVDAVIPDDAGINRSALDNGTQRGKIAVWKADRRSEAAFVRRLRIENHVVRVNAVALFQCLSQAR